MAAENIRCFFQTKKIKIKTMNIKITKQIEQKIDVTIELPYYAKGTGISSSKYLAILTENSNVEVSQYGFTEGTTYLVVNSNNKQNSKDLSDYEPITESEFYEKYVAAITSFNKTIEDGKK